MAAPKGNKFAPGGKRPGSGRPLGKKDEVKDTAKKYTTEAIKRLAHWMRSDEAKASVTASIALLDRAWGKPAQAVTVGGDADNPLPYSISVNFKQ